MDQDLSIHSVLGTTAYHFDGAARFESPIWAGIPVLSMGPESPIPPWLVRNGIAPNADVISDPNGDGVSLLMAYALALDPSMNLSGSMPQPIIAGNQLRISFHGNSEGITYSVETSSNLQVWTTEDVMLTEPDGNGTRTATVDINMQERFLRLVVKH